MNLDTSKVLKILVTEGMSDEDVAAIRRLTRRLVKMIMTDPDAMENADVVYCAAMSVVMTHALLCDRYNEAYAALSLAADRLLAEDTKLINARRASVGRLH